MTDLFWHLVELHLAACAALLIVLVSRNFIRRQGGPELSYTLWLIVPLAAAATLIPARTVLETAPLELPRQIIQFSDDKFPDSSRDFSAGTVQSPDIMASAEQSLTPHSRKARISGASVISVLCFVWIAGVIVTFGFHALRQLHYHRSLGILQRYHPAGNRAYLCSRNDRGPALIGILHPRIILPADFAERYSAEEQALILAHENTHIIRGDLYVLLAAIGVASLFWFNPLFTASISRLQQDQELACDAATLRRNPGKRRSYGNVMLKDVSPLRMASPLGCQWHPQHPVKERITMILEKRPTTIQRRTGAMMVAILCAGTAGCAWAVQPVQTIPAASASLSVIESEKVAQAFSGKEVSESLTYRAPAVDLKYINAVLRVVPENRTDIAIDLYDGPRPTFAIRDDNLVIDGGLEKWSQQYNTDWCELGKQPEDRSVMLIRVPSKAAISWYGAVDASVAAMETGSISTFGCGHTDIAAVSDDFSVTAGNSTSMTIASVGGDMAVSAMNSSRMTIGPVAGDVSANIMNSSQLEMQSIASDANISAMNSSRGNIGLIGSDLNANVMNSASLAIDTVRDDTSANVMNSGNLTVQNTDELSINQNNSGKATIGSVRASLDASLGNGSKLNITSLENAPHAKLNISSDSDVEITGGAIEELTLNLEDDAVLQFGGRVARGTIWMDSDRDSYIAEAVSIKMSKDSRADGEISFGQINQLN